MQIQFIQCLDDIAAAQWDALDGTDSPFLNHAFLSALERHHCVGAQLGWQSSHLAAFDSDVLVGAMPLYIKDNSYGELVFDWAWADAYQRMGRRYYPKLVSAVPYTPAPGPRLLLHPDYPQAKALLLEALLDFAQQGGYSSLHCLFPEEADQQALEEAGLLPRLSCLFRWENHNYLNFDDFLAQLSSRKRKQIRKERNRIHSSDIQIEQVHGHEASEQQWRAMADFYRHTFDSKGGLATFNLPFFLDISQTMGENILLILAKQAGRYVAGSLLYKSADTLFGRHWGSHVQVDSLHFELCYYQGMDYAIRQGLRYFDPGVQGEHKVVRGFLPHPGWSYHWLRDEDFGAAVADFLTRERQAMQNYMHKLQSLSPYKKTT